MNSISWLDWIMISNKFESLNMSLFFGLENITRFHLPTNLIPKFISFKQGGCVFDSNKVKTFSEDAFHGFKKLQSLIVSLLLLHYNCSFHSLSIAWSLRSMGIKSLSSDFFKDLTNLFSLYHFTSCSNRDIHLLNEIVTFQWWSLASNELQTLPSNVFSHATHLKSFYHLAIWLNTITIRLCVNHLIQWHGHQ